MSPYAVSVVIPTITGREEWLKRSVMSLAQEAVRCGYDTNTIIIRDRPTCGEAWNEGIAQARADYILLSADDITYLPDWLAVGKFWVDDGYIPCPRVLNPDGTMQSCGSNAEENPTGTVSDLARVPFMSRQQADAIGPILPIHYFSDYWVTHRGRQHGWATVVVRDFQFVHHFADVGRIDERLMADKEVFDAALPNGVRHYA